jgi:hypothetical protein
MEDAMLRKLIDRLLGSLAQATPRPTDRDTDFFLGARIPHAQMRAIGRWPRPEPRTPHCEL